jgi:hypothetical protein
MLSSSLSVRETKVDCISSRVPTIRRGLGPGGAAARLSLTLGGPKA